MNLQTVDIILTSALLKRDKYSLSRLSRNATELGTVS